MKTKEKRSTRVVTIGARLLYTMYTRQMSAIMDDHKVRYYRYADDTQVYLEYDNNEAAVRHGVSRLESV